MVEMAEDNNCLLQVDFHKRFDPSYQELRSLVEAGSLGDVEYGYAHMENRIEVPKNWLGGWVENTSPNWFLGVHMYDLVRYVTGLGVVCVSATGVKRKLPAMGIDSFDSIHAKLILENGGSFSVDTSWILPDGHEAIVNQGFRLIGSEGMMELDSQYRGVRGCLKTPTDSRPAKESGMQTWNLEFYRRRHDARGNVRYSGYGIESIEDFVGNVNGLINGTSLEDLKGHYADGKDGLEATRIAAAVEESVESNGELIRVG
jgi:predicted dehydrogenase